MWASTPVEVPPALWGGYSEYLYLHPNSILHRVPERVPPEHAAFALPLSNGIQMTQLDAGVRMGDVVVIQGPGQQGIGCVIASKAAEAATIIVSGLARDRKRLERASELGATHVVNVETQDLRTVVEEATAGEFADVAIDVSGAGPVTLDAALDLVRKRGTVVLASGSQNGAAPVDLNRIRRKQIIVKGVRGHSHRAVELALHLIGSGDLPLEVIGGSPFPLSRAKEAFDTIEGLHDLNSVHATVAPAGLGVGAFAGDCTESERNQRWDRIQESTGSWTSGRRGLRRARWPTWWSRS